MMHSVVSPSLHRDHCLQPITAAASSSASANNSGDFAELFNEMIANNVDTDGAEDMLESFDLGIAASDLFPVDIFPTLEDTVGQITDSGDAAMLPDLDGDGLADTISTPEHSDSDSGLGSASIAGGSAHFANLAAASTGAEEQIDCSRTRPFDWRRSRERAPDDCTRLRVEDFVAGGRLAGFLAQPQQQQQQQRQLYQVQLQHQNQLQQQLTSATQLFKSEPTDDFLARHQQQQLSASYCLIQPRRQHQQLLLIDGSASMAAESVEFSGLTSAGSPSDCPSSPMSTTNSIGPVVQSQAALIQQQVPPLVMSEGEQAKVKRLERMIKNRHSASESRRKRKEYLDGLERRVQSLASENAFLRDENSQLRQRYSELERKLISLEHALSGGAGGIGSAAAASTGRRRPVTVMAILLFVGLNLVGLGVWPLAQQQQPGQAAYYQSSMPDNTAFFYGNGAAETRALVPYRRGPSTGRHLLSTSSAGPADQPAPEELSALFGRLCPVHNSTESARLAKELDGWAFRYQREAGARELRRLHRQRTRREERMKRRAEATAAAAAAAAAVGGGSALQLRYGRDTSLDLLMRALDRREDTMYLVSFRSDHLVFPALAANKTAAPRMTFLMPAVNESGHTSARGTVPLMQIDCEVVNVGLMHLDKWRVPLQFRQDLFGNNRV